MIRILFIIVIIGGNFTKSFSQTHLLDSVEISASRSAKKTSNSITEIDRKKIDAGSSFTIIDELSKVANVNVQSRGFLGGQSDISIRGGNYEQVAVFFNGIRINNPQTGHNGMLYPTMIQDIDRIEISKGGASKYFGANSYTGTISLSTKKPEKNGLNGNFALGSYSTSSLFLNYNLVKKNHWHKLSGSYLNSVGYRTNTDIEAIQIFSENHFMMGKNWDMYGTAGFHSKKFGANGFYSLRFPNQYEELQSYFYNFGLKNKFIKFDAYWNQVNDYFLLKREQPSFYKNTHYTDARGIKISSITALSNTLYLNSNAEFRNEHIKSSNLGNRDRNIYNFNSNIDWNIHPKLTTNLGFNFNYIHGFSPFLTGGLNIKYALNSYHSFYSSVNSSFRIPSFTELYYTSPTDSGKANLTAETAKSFDLGYSFKNKILSFQLGGYMRFSNNQIDWIKPSTNSSYYESKNISQIISHGIESNVQLNLQDIIGTSPLQHVDIAYAHNEYSLDSTANTKYSFSILRNQLIVSAYLKYSKKLYQYFNLRIEDRPSLNIVYALLDTRIEYKLSPIPSSIYLTIQNLANTKYQYFTDIPMPGINFMAGVKFELK